MLNAALAEQKAGRVVCAEEVFEMVLSLYPSKKFAWFDLGVMEQEAGRINEAILLCQGALRQDPNFSPAKNNMEYIMRTRYGFANPHPR